MRVEIEICDECGFDGSDYSRGSARASLKDLGKWWAAMVADVDAAALARRPAPETWSAIEYGAHTAEVTAAMGYLVHLLETDAGFGLRVPDAPAFGTHGEVAPPASLSRGTGIDAVLESITSNATRMARKTGGLDEAAWTAIGLLDGEPVDADWILRHAVHDATHHLRDVGRNLAAGGIGPAPQTGRVAGVFTSGGGVPKKSVESVEVDASGVRGDAQANSRDHGRPFQAVCLWSADIVDSLRDEGHRIYPGAAGENVSIDALDWASLRPGTRMQVGEDVVIEISCAAAPCAKNAQWFSDGDFRRIDAERHPGSSRLYGWVVRDGTIRPGDQVRVGDV